MTNEELMMVQKKIGYFFKTPSLLCQAFIRRSYSKENGGQDNEVLELIGDKVLDIAVIRYLNGKYGAVRSNENGIDEFCCELTEGKLTQLKANMVEKAALARRIDCLDFAGYLIMGNGDIQNKTAQENSVKEDLFEAIIGAVAIDTNWDFEVLQKVVEKMLDPDDFSLANENFVQMIENWCLKENGKLPDYDYYEHTDIKETNSGSNSKDDKKFMCKLKLQDNMSPFIAEGKSKSEARKKCCEKAYIWLKENNGLASIRDEIKNPNTEDSINQLETLSRRGYFSLPVYRFVQTAGKENQPCWEAICQIESLNLECTAEASSKKEAKKMAAFKMLCGVLNNR